MASVSQDQQHIRSTSYAQHPRKEETAASTLPKYDDSRTTIICCMFSLILAWLAIIGCLIAVVLIAKRPGSEPSLKLIRLSRTATEALTFTTNIIVTLVIDCLGFIHGTSLRWALYREGRLHFNSNIRLLTSARKSAPNRWPSNVLCFACMILCYAATSQLFLKYGFSTQLAEYVWINTIAIAALGLGLMGQAIVATWCVFSTLKETPTWSSNPLNNALVRLWLGDMDHVEGRCMMSVHQQNLPSEKTRPQVKQRSPFAVRDAIKYVIALIWSLTILGITWAVTILLLSRHTMRVASSSPWNLTASWYMIEAKTDDNGVNFVTLYMDPSWNGGSTLRTFSLPVQVFCAILFTSAVQGAQTIGLHCVEILVNISRDENVWRSAALPRQRPKVESQATGAQLKVSAIKAAVTSWESALLFLLKALLHCFTGYLVSPCKARFSMKSIRLSWCI
jgi:hypothetical protein